MIKRIRLSIPLLALAYSLGGWGIAFAQQPSFGIAKDTLKIAESAVVVTGEFSPAAQQDALRQVRLIGQQTMQGMAALSARDVLRNTLGLQTSEDAILGSGLTVQGLRGENVKVLIDGVPVVGRLNGNVDLSQINLADVARIELVDGPMSVEYGTNALAGTINFITDQSRGKRNELSTSQRYESVGQYTSEVHAIWGRGGNFIRFGAQRNYFDGWSPKDRPLDWIEDFQADSNRTSAWNPKIQQDFSFAGQHLGERCKWTSSMRLFNEQIEDRGLPRAPYGEWAFDNHYVTKRASSSVSFKTYKDGWDRWDVLAAWNRFVRQKTGYRTDLTTISLVPLTDPTAHDTTRVDLWMTRGALNSTPSSRIKLRSGWDISRESYAGPRVAGQRQMMVNAALFTLGRYTAGRTEHQLGLRWAWNSTYAAPVLPSWHTLVSGEHLRWRFSYARGFRAPSLKELHFVFVDVNHQLMGNPDLLAESSHNLQLSCSHTAPRRVWQFSSFFNAVQNQIDFVQSDTENHFVYRNIGEFKSHGSRLNLSGEGVDWHWKIGGAWIAQASSVNLFKYTHTPEFTVQGGWSPVDRLELFTSAKYSGSQVRFFETTDEQGELLLDSYRLAPFTLLDATATFRSKSCVWMYMLGVRNALNVGDVAIASSSSDGSSGPGSGAHSGTDRQMMAWGRTLVASIRWTLSPSNR
ncbi:MAG: TonB-dependent receptor [Flavobacteriales bacterium]|nr:TonB-dependent receptor [Flavobacteriales bacterium]